MLTISDIFSHIYFLKKNFLRSVSFLFDFFHIRILIIILVGLNLLIWFLALFVNYNVSQSLIVLHYNIDFGVDLIGEAKRLYIIPLLGLVIILINKILLMTLFKNEHFKFISYLLLLSALFVNFILLIALSIIYLINFR
jgi:hypothetical protein